MNRKMFNRNARNKLNAMGGVASFQLGGSPLMATNPLTKSRGSRGIPTSGIGAVQDINPELINLLGITRPRAPGRGGGISGLSLKEMPLRPQGVMENIFQPESTLQSAQAQSMMGGSPLSTGVSPGFQQAVTGSPVGAPSQDKLLDVFKQISGAPNPLDTLKDQERMQQGQISPVLQEQRDVAEEENLIAGDDPDKKKIIKPDPVKPTITEEQQKILDDQKRRQVGQLGTILPKTKEEIAKVINEGTDKEKQDELKQLMQEFTQNAPQYEGLDKGLAIAKIGFAMAAGQSPDAITNIAKALEGGADMFIKDKKQRDDFNRQVQLSALKYGLQEKSKIASENRLIAKERRGFKDYVVGPGGTTYRGKRYEANETIPVNIGDIRDGNLPDNLFADTTIAALLKEKAAYNKLLADARKNKTIKPTELTKQIENYNSAVSDAIDAESGMALIEGAMITVSEGGVTGLSGVVSDAVLRGGAFFGMDLTKNYGSKTEVRNAMKAALQKTIPVTLGRTQSANSISNRDVDFLITAYFGEGALDGGILTFAAETETEMVKRLQRAHEQMQNAQKGAFATIKTTEAFLSPLIQPGTSRSAAGLLSADRTRLAEAGLAPGGEEGFGTYVGGQKVVRQIGATRGDDGVIRLDLSK